MFLNFHLLKLLVMTKNIQEKTIGELFAANAHLGHRKNRLHPKARKFVYKIINGSAVIDLTKTVGELEKAEHFISSLRKEGKTLLIVATKKISHQFIAELSIKYGIPYITTKWPPGLLTNFEMIMRNVKRLNTLQEERNNGSWEKFVKHEIVQLEKEIAKLKKFYGGITQLTKKPDALLIVDTRKEKNALKEAQEYKIPVVALLDTNSDPSVIDYPVVANDDSAGSIEYILTKLTATYGAATREEAKKTE